MLRSANIATMPSRLDVLPLMLKSIEGQFDVIRICLNGFDSVPKFLEDHPKILAFIPKYNLTDNGKFSGVGLPMELGIPCFNSSNEYYFTLDDDIIYPPDYVEKTVENIDTYGCIVTYHGRILLATDVNYYQDHDFHHCIEEQKANFEVDVCGTGVTAFRTDYFCPSEIAYSEDQLMSDLVFSLEATKQGKTIGCCARPAHWIKGLPVKETIFKHFQTNSKYRQTEIANEIYRVKHNIKAPQST